MLTVLKFKTNFVENIGRKWETKNNTDDHYKIIFRYPCYKFVSFAVEINILYTGGIIKRKKVLKLIYFQLP